jgi:hypothetical protein
MFDFSKSTWESIPGRALPSPRFDAGFTYASGRLYLFGGRTNFIGIAFYDRDRGKLIIASLTSFSAFLG